MYESLLDLSIFKIQCGGVLSKLIQNKISFSESWIQ